MLNNPKFEMRNNTKATKLKNRLILIGTIFALILVSFLFTRNEVNAIKLNEEFYKLEDGYVTRILPETTVGDLKNNLEIDGFGNVEVINQTGDIVEENEYVGSAMTLNIGKESYKLSVIGDLDGNGLLTITDLVKLKLHQAKLKLLEDKYIKSADLNGSGSISITDLVHIKLSVVKIKDLIAPKGFTPTVSNLTNAITISGETTDNRIGEIEYYFKINDGDWVQNSDKTKASYTFENLSATDAYRLRMKAKDKAGNQVKTKEIVVAYPIYAILYDDGTLAFSLRNEAISGKTVVKYYGDVLGKNYNNNAPWYEDGKADEITKVEFIDKIAPTSTAYWFAHCSNLETINNISNVNTSNVTSMKSMFEGCSKLTSLNLISFDTRKVTDVSKIFSMMPELQEVIVGENWIVEQADTTDMFKDSAINKITRVI